MEDNRLLVAFRKQIAEFYKSDNKVFSFEVNCPIPERIEFIYGVIFPGMKRLAFYFRFMLSRIAQIVDYSPLKVFLYRAMGVKIGKGVFLSPDVFIDPHFPELIELGDYCILGWGCKLFCHEFVSNIYRIGRIQIGYGAVIGGFAVVRGGVQIGNESEIGFQSFVNCDVSEKTHYVSKHKHIMVTDLPSA